MLGEMLLGKGQTRELYCAVGSQEQGLLGVGGQPIAVRALNITRTELYTHVAVLHKHGLTTSGFAGT